MAKKRLYLVAREYNITSDAIVKMCHDLGYPVKNHMSTADDEMLTAIDMRFKKERETIKREIETKRMKAISREKERLLAQKKEKQLEQEKDKEKGRGARDDELEQYDEAAPKTGIEKIKAKDNKPVSKPPGDRRRRHKKDKRRGKFKRKVIDQKEVASSVRKTLAGMDGKRLKKYKRRTKGPGGVGEEITNVLQVIEFMSIAELASEIGIRPTELIAKCIGLGMMATINQRLDIETIQTLALEYGYEIEEVQDIGIEEAEDEHEEEEAIGEPRPPVITIMGHVDHGKTSLLDFIRHSNIIAGESGLITQHIGAYQVELPSGKLTFLDTPGHAAFTAMRARGAQVTDIVVLVVAANDAVQQQTVEAIDHARAAGVPIIVAINKMDLPDSNAETVRQQLAQHNLLAEDWGGKTITVEISAKTGANVDKLLEMILLQAEIMELRANHDAKAKGIVIEAKVERGKGVVCSLLVQSGSLKLSDPVVIGNNYAKVRTIVDDRDRSLTEVGPGLPAQITGLSGMPQAGDRFFVTADESQARTIAGKRQRIKREQDFRHLKRVALSNVYDQIREGQISELNLIIKGDVDGSAEVLCDTLEKLSNDEVRVVIIHRGVGAVNENDVLLAAASHAIIIGFHVRPDAHARAVAAREKVDIRLYTIIYEVESEVRKALEGLLSPEETEEVKGTAEVRNLFKIPKQGVVAGCYVQSGTISKSDRIRVVRDGTGVYDGLIGSLRRFKDDVREVASGFECGINVENFADVKVGDVLETYVVIQVARKLQP
jgi:translation initiation factor IF-2